MKILAMHSTLIIIFSSILIACGASSGNDNKSANESSISKKIESLNNTLNTVFDSLPEASTGLPYSSHALDLSSSNNHLFHASGLPSWATLDSQTGQIHGIPDNKDAGVFDLNLSLSQNGLTVEKQIPLIVRHISAHKIADEISFYEHGFDGEKRILRNDLTGKLNGEVQFMQSHNVRPNNNLKKIAVMKLAVSIILD